MRVSAAQHAPFWPGPTIQAAMRSIALGWISNGRERINFRSSIDRQLSARFISVLPWGLLSGLHKWTPRALFRLTSVWMLLALVVSAILQMPRATGQTLETFGAPFVAGWLGQLYLLSFFIDALRGVLPWLVVFIPILFYSGYYFAYWEQGVQARLRSLELRDANPVKIVDFNTASYSLVMDQADAFVASHDIPVAYTYNWRFRPENYLSNRLISKNHIGNYIKSYDHYNLLSIYWDNTLLPNLAVLQVPERPSHPILSVHIRNNPGQGWKDWNIGEQITSLHLGGHTVGVFRSAYIERLPILPFFTIGCKFLSDPPRRRCGSNFVTERVNIESRPDHVNHDVYGDPVGIMLGVKLLSKDSIANLREDATTKIGNGPEVRIAPGEDEAFAALTDIIEARNPRLSWMMSYLIENSPTRLGPLAGGMAKRLVDLSRTDKSIPEERKQKALLAAGIAALDPSDFAGVEDQLISLARNGALREDYPLLYLRLADASPNMFSIYRDQFMAPGATKPQRLLAALAICRLGQADGELAAAMKSEWFSDSDAEGPNDDNYKAALFVALLKLGRADALKSASRSNSKALQSWYDANLAGHGKTEVGPNNCMPMEWPGNDYVPPFLAPRLRWARNEWTSTN